MYKDNNITSSVQVKSLPIQQPKLKTLRNTLESFEKQLEQVSILCSIMCVTGFVKTDQIVTRTEIQIVS